MFWFYHACCSYFQYPNLSKKIMVSALINSPATQRVVEVGYLQENIIKYLQSPVLLTNYYMCIIGIQAHMQYRPFSLA